MQPPKMVKMHLVGVYNKQQLAIVAKSPPPILSVNVPLVGYRGQFVFDVSLEDAELHYFITYMTVLGEMGTRG